METTKTTFKNNFFLRTELEQGRRRSSRRVRRAKLFLKVVLVVSKTKCVDASRITRLGDPVVVALAGETNRVPLLMGVEYAVTSSVPLAVWAEDGYATIVTNNARNYTVSWPLLFGVAVSQGGGYSINVQPFDPGGEFSCAPDVAMRRLARICHVRTPPLIRNATSALLQSNTK